MVIKSVINTGSGAGGIQFKADLVSIEEILNGERCEIPKKVQRKYAWRREHVQDLLDDILASKTINTNISSVAGSLQGLQGTTDY